MPAMKVIFLRAETSIRLQEVCMERPRASQIEDLQAQPITDSRRQPAGRYALASILRL